MIKISNLAYLEILNQLAILEDILDQKEILQEKMSKINKELVTDLIKSLPEPK